MDRRNFVRALVAGGSLNWAAGAQAAPDGTSDVALHDRPYGGIVIQRGLAPAGELAQRLRLTLAGAGLADIAIEARELDSFAAMADLLPRRRGAWLIGVTQDAAAELIQGIAASQGCACVLHASHRFSEDGVRHCCTTAAAPEAWVWTEGRSAATDELGRLYAEALGLGAALAPLASTSARRHAWPTAAPVSLASFLIRT